jgi:hypothetical protein
MNLSFFSSFLKKNKQNLKLPDSLLLKKLKKTAQENNLFLYENVTIYHHSKSFDIPLIVLNPKCGIYLFEYKGWSYDDLKNATISKAQNQNASEDSLAFEKTHTFLKQKFNELTHNDGVPIYNYLLMENLNSYEYKHLATPFKELLPEQSVFFNDSSDSDILNKLLDQPELSGSIPNIANIMGNLLIQYSILDDNNNLNLATNEQISFIDSTIVGEEKLTGDSGSGKTTSVILKAILELLKNPSIKIVIIKPTVMACNIIKKKLLDIVERSLVEVDVTTIKVITPKDLKKVDLILCDDAYMYNDEYISYLKNIQKNNSLILVNPKNKSYPKYHFNKKFDFRKNVIFQQGNPHALTLHKLFDILKTNDPKDILIVSNNQSRKKLYEDLEHFIENKVVMLDSSKSLLYQDENTILLCSYTDIYELRAKHVILLDICLTSTDKLKYAFNICTDNVYVLYEEECDKLSLIKENFEEY